MEMRASAIDADASSSLQQSEAAIRATQNEIWSSTARRRADTETGKPSELTDILISRAGVAPGMKVLDIACGSGDPALWIAQKVRAAGGVEAFDLSPEMIDAARKRAAASGIGNIEFETIANECQLPTAGPFDAVTCRFGLMLMPNPARALRCWKQLMRRGAHVAVCTHGNLPSLSITMSIVEKYAPEIANKLMWRQTLSLSKKEKLKQAFSDAGFSKINVTEKDVVQATVSSPQAGWEALMSRSPLFYELSNLPQETADQIRFECTNALFGTNPSDVITLSGQVLVASAIRT